MAFQSRIGRAVLELSVEGGTYVRGLEDAKANYRAFARGIADTNRDISRQAFQLSGRQQIADTAKLVEAVTRVGGATRLVATDQARVNAALKQGIEHYKVLGKEAPKAWHDIERATRRADDARSKMAAGMAAMGVMGRQSFERSQASAAMIAGMSASGRAALDATKAAQATSPAMQVLTTRMIALGTAAGTFGSNLAMQAVRGIVNMGRAAFTTSSEIVDLASKAGVSTAAIQRFQHVAKQTGGTLEAFTTASFQLSQRIAGGGDSVTDAVGKLGIEWARLRQARPEQQFDMVIRALERITDVGERNRLGSLLFGRSFAEVAASVEQGYSRIADAARITSDAHLRALDRASKRWEQFKTDVQSSVTGVIGSALLMRDVLRQIENEERNRPSVSSRESRAEGDARRLIEAERRIRLGLVDQKTKDVALTMASAVAMRDYVKELAAAERELKKLDAAEQKQIQSAQEMGLGTEHLEEMLVRFGVEGDKAESVLRLYNAQLREGEKASIAFAKAQKEAAEAAAKAAETWFDVLVQMDRAQLASDRAFQAAQRPDPFAPFPFTDEAFAQVNVDKDMARMELETEAIKKRTAAWREFEQFLGERRMEDDASRMRARDEAIARALQPFNDLRASITGSATSGLFTMLTGVGDGIDRAAKQRAADAKQHFEQLKASGTASAQAITRAYREMHEANAAAQTRFADRWDHWLDGLKSTFSSWVNDLVGMWLRHFLNRLMQSALNSRVGQTLTGWAMNLLPGGAGLGIPGASAAPSLGSLLGAAPAGASAAGGAGAGALGFLSNPGFWTNPWTIGVAIGLTAAPFIVDGIKSLTGHGPQSRRTLETIDRKHPGLRFRAIGPNGELYGSFPAMEASGAFTPRSSGSSGLPAVGRWAGLSGSLDRALTMPDVRSGGGGRDSAPPTRPSGGGGGAAPRHTTIDIRINALDGADVERVWKQKIRPRLIEDMRSNEGQLGSTTREVALS